MTALAIEGLAVAYGSHVAVGDVSLEVAPGEIVALVGPSGSGKSSIALAVAGLLPADAIVTGRIAADAAIGFVFQDPLAALNPALSIGRQIGEAWRGPRGERTAAVAAALGRVGLDVPPTRFPHQLSGGQRQRAMIAMATIGRPALIVADEPTAALDPTSRARIAALLADVARGEGAGLLLITHDRALAGTLADRVLTLERGRMVETTSLSPSGDRLGWGSTTQNVGRWSAPNAPTPTPPLKGRGLPVVLILNHVTRRFGAGWRASVVTALDDLSLAIAAGEAIGVIGESGAGKTSLARIALGLDRPDAGEVAIGGIRVGRAVPRAVRRTVQAVFQDPAASFDPRWTVARIVAEPLALLDDLAPADKADRVVAALCSVELDPAFADRLPHALSGGQRQRVALARALVIDPRLVVLDEALSALDPRLRGEMIALLRGLQRERGLAYLLIGHDLAAMDEAVDRLVVLREGRIVEQGPTREVLERPRDPYTAALVAAAPPRFAS